MRLKYLYHIQDSPCTCFPFRYTLRLRRLFPPSHISGYRGCQPFAPGKPLDSGSVVLSDMSSCLQHIPSEGLR